MDNVLFGILLGEINEPFANMTNLISGDKVSLTGYFYEDNRGMHIFLYRSFDGSQISYFNTFPNLIAVVNHPMIKNIDVITFKEEEWIVDGNKSDLKERFVFSANKILMSTLTKTSYDEILKYYAKLSNKIIINGYYLLNKIILSCCDVDQKEYEDSLSKEIIQTMYMNEPFSVAKTTKKLQINCNPTPSDLAKETNERFADLSSAFIRLITEDESYQIYLKQFRLYQSSNETLNNFLSVVSNGFLSEEEKRKAIRALNFSKSENSNVKTFGIDREFNSLNETLVLEGITELRKYIEILMEGFNSNKVPVIHIPEIIENFNKLVDGIGMERISKTEEIENSYRSIGVMAVAGFDAFNPNETKILLKSGETYLIATKYSDIEHYNDVELTKILRYLISNEQTDNRFSHLIACILEKLGKRVGSRKRVKTQGY
jgi:hypothetical protein